ncbi:MAG: SIMPL domain-containing protein [Veillonellaceae bacterium]|nr:SIMPL domain-containing protein [Veillonellaceae bacterium]
MWKRTPVLRKANYLAVAACLALLPFVAAPNAAAAAPDTAAVQRTVTVDGVASRDLVPTRGRLSFGIVGQAADAQTAKAEYDRQMNEVIRAVRALGINEQELQTSSFAISPLYNNPEGNQAPKIVGYRVSSMLTYTTRNLESLPRVLEAAVSAGANNIGDISFLTESTPDMDRQLLQDAVNNGKTTADTIARAAGMRLGKLVSAQVHRRYEQGGVLRAYAAKADAAPIFAGTQPVSVTVQLVFEIM